MLNNKLFKSMFLLLCMIVGAGSAWAEEVTYTISSKNTLTTTGTAPTGSSATIAETYGTSKQMTNGNSQTLTLSRYDGYKITSIGLSMKSNKSAGAGKLSYSTDGGSTFSYIVGTANNGVQFQEAGWYGSYSQEYVDVTKSNLDITCGSSNVIIKVEATVNSLYCQSYKITYEKVSSAALTSIALSGDYPTTFSEGGTFSHGGMTVTATYDDSSTSDVTSKATFSGYDMSTPGSQIVTVSYTEKEVTKTADYGITVNAVPSHNVTFSVNGQTTVNSVKEGAAITFPTDPANVNDKSFVGWVTEAIDGATDEKPAFVTSATMGNADVTYYAVFATVTGSGESGWIETPLSEMSSSDVFVIAADTEYAMTNDNGTSSAPVIAYIEVANNKLTSEVTDNMKWNVGGNATDGYVFYKNGSTTEWLYCNTTSNTSNNNNIRVGDGGRKLWVFDANNYLKTKDSYTVRYLSMYSHQDFRGYVNTDNGAFAPTFYKYNVGNTYSEYCTSVVKAAVERPVIKLAENPFLFSTTATINCDTEDATIYYSYDNENWTEYTDALNITATTTIYAKAVKGNDESYVASVIATKNLAEPTVTISGDLTVDLNGETSVNAGTLTAAVTYEEKALEDATVTWSSSDERKATIDAQTGVVTIFATGSVTFTATYAGNEDYAEATATKTITIIDSKVPGASAENPYTVAQALENTPSSGNVYVKGVVSRFYRESITGDNSHRYYISDNGAQENELLVYNGKGLDNVAFSSDDDLQIGDEVVIVGQLTTYQGTKEFAKDNYIVSLKRVQKPAAPTFSVEEGMYTETQSVELSCATEGATIYYTVDGTTKPTTESTEYTEAIVVSETTTIKAIAVKDGVSSDVATATYTINHNAFIELSTTMVEAPADGADGTITVAYNNITDVTAKVKFYEADGETAATYNWIDAEIDDDNNVSYLIEENTSSEARTAYMKVYAGDNNGGEVYSELITITQAGMVVDYATLPFEWDDKSTPIGVTNSGVATYSSSPYLKFDGTGDNIVLKINEDPGVLYFDIKGNSFSGGTFTVQTSADGKTYSDLATYSDDNLQSSAQTEAYALNATVRYIKWVYTEKSTGNVALGNIIVDKVQTATISDAGYAAYVTKYNVSFPAGVTAYIVDKVNQGYVNLVEKAAVPAGTPVILKGEESTYTLNPASELKSVSENKLLVSDGKVEGDGTIYALANKSNGVGFYRVANGLAVPAGKPYLVVPAAESEAREFIGFYDDSTTGIADITVKKSNETLYNLNGQRVETMKSGLYIVDGKKVFIRK